MIRPLKQAIAQRKLEYFHTEYADKSVTITALQPIMDHHDCRRAALGRYHDFRHEFRWNRELERRLLRMVREGDRFDEIDSRLRCGKGMSRRRYLLLSERIAA